MKAGELEHLKRVVGEKSRLHSQPHRKLSLGSLP